MKKFGRILAGTFAVAGMISMLFLAACPDPDPKKPEVTTYDVTLAAAQNGTLTADVEKAAEGATVTVTAIPAAEFKFVSLAITGGVAYTPAGGNNYTFTMPAYNVTVTATFEPDIPIPGEYNVTKGAITPAGSGDFTIDPTRAEEGVTITLVPTANAGFEFVGFNTTPSVDVIAGANNWTFVMPGANVSVAATFVEEGKVAIAKGTPEGGDFTISPDAESYDEGTVITLTLEPDDEYEFVEWVFVPDTINPTLGADGKYTFTINENVSINAIFKLKLYEIEVTAATNGEIEIEDDLEEAPKDAVITVTLTPDENYRVKEITAEGGLDLTNTTTPAGSLIQTWTFKMGTEKVTVSAEFEIRPNYPITLPTGLEGDGVVTVSPLLDATNAIAGETITIDLEFDTDDYRISEALKVVLVSDESEEVPVTQITSAARWTFVMPEEAVKITVEIEFIPWFEITLTTGANGTASFAGGGTGTNAGQARGGNLITVTADPDSGYEVDDYGLSITPDTPVTTVDENTFTFLMPEDDVILNLNFARIGHKVLFTDGPIPGLTIAQLTGEGTWGGWLIGDPPRFAFVDEPNAGRGDDTAIKFTRGTGETSFQLNLASPMSMRGVGGLSFWARTSSGTGGIRLIGIGDAGATSGTRVMTSGTGHEVGTGTGGQVSVNGTWQQYVIPFPHPETTSTRSLSRALFMKMNTSPDRDIFIDDVEFVPISDIELLSIAIPATSAEIPWGGTPAAASFFNFARTATAAQDVVFSYRHIDGGATTIFRPRDMGTSYINWNLLVPADAYTYSVEGDNVSIDTSGNLVATERGATANLYLHFNGVRSSAMAIRWSEGGEQVTVTPVPAANGTVTLSGVDASNNALPDNTVTVNATVNMGFLFGNITITQTEGGAAVPFEQDGTALRWTFVMPEAPVTVTVTINADPNLLVIEDFEVISGGGGDNSRGAWWKTFGWVVRETGTPLHIGGQARLTINSNFADNQRNHMAIGRSYTTTFNATNYDVVSIYIRFHQLAVQTENTFTFSLVSGAPANVPAGSLGNTNDFPYTTGNISTASFTVPTSTVNTWREIRIPMADFVGEADMTAINGWIFAVDPITPGPTATVFDPLPSGTNRQNNINGMSGTGEHQIRLDTFTFQKD